LCIFQAVGNHFIYVVLYVDDMLLVGNNMDVIKEVKSQRSENRRLTCYAMQAPLLH
jgi:hypothetical protein